MRHIGNIIVEDSPHHSGYEIQLFFSKSIKVVLRYIFIPPWASTGLKREPISFAVIQISIFKCIIWFPKDGEEVSRIKVSLIFCIPWKIKKNHQLVSSDLTLCRTQEGFRSGWGFKPLDEPEKISVEKWCYFQRLYCNNNLSPNIDNNSIFLLNFHQKISKFS